MSRSASISAAQRVRLLPLVLAMVLFGGCGPIGYAPRLVGTWVGEPETAEQRVARSPANADSPDGSSEKEDGGQRDQADTADGGLTAAREEESGAIRRTALESVDVRVTLDLSPGGGARMWVGDAEETALRGSWRVVSFERDRATIELTAQPNTNRGSAGGEAKSGASGEEDGEAGEQKRRFAVQLMEDDNAFTLAEEGADRFFGRLYFRRLGE